MASIVTQKQKSVEIQPTAQTTEGGSPSRITRLPDKIMSNVCEFIPGQEVVRNMQRLCKSWKPPLLGTWGWSHWLTDEKFITLIHRTSIITSIRLTHCSNITTQSFQYLTTLAKLQDLTTLHLNWSTRVEQAALESVAKLPNLKTLSLIWFHITNEGVKSVAKFPNLTSLSLNECCNRITNQDLEYVALLQKLKNLSLKGYSQITHEGIEHLTGLQNLRTFDIEGCNSLTDNTLKSVAKFKRLTALNLNSCCKFTAEGIDSLIELRTLRELNVRRCSQLITDDTLARLAEKLPNLIILDIGQCPEVTDEGLKSVAKLLKLRELDLEECLPITNEGLKSVAKLLKLRKLNLMQCRKITEKGLLESVVKLPELQSLHLETCSPIQLQNIIDSHSNHYIENRQHLKNRQNYVKKITSIFNECVLFPEVINLLIIDYYLLTPLVVKIRKQ